MLEEKTHLPAVLQSLGCIAQTAMSVFETRESEIEGFIKRNILECSNVCLLVAWFQQSVICSWFMIISYLKQFFSFASESRRSRKGKLGWQKWTLFTEGPVAIWHVFYPTCFIFNMIFNTTLLAAYPRRDDAVNLSCLSIYQLTVNFNHFRSLGLKHWSRVTCLLKMLTFVLELMAY